MWTMAPKQIAAGKPKIFARQTTGNFLAPPHVSQLIVTPLALFASIARTIAIRDYPSSLGPALFDHASALTRVLLDDSTADFDISTDIKALEQSERSGFAGRLGAGLCDLYMTALGYVWRDLASVLIPTAAPLGDFVYEGGAANGAGVVLAEAKGSLRAGSSKGVRIQTIANEAYKRQVEPYVGLNTLAGVILHGYATCFGAQPGQISGFLKVAETSRLPSTSVPMGASKTIGAPLQVCSRSTALGNYRDVFRSIGAGGLADRIEQVRNGQRLLREQYDLEKFQTVSIDTQTSIVVPNWRSAAGFIPRDVFTGTILGIESSIFDAVLDRLVFGNPDERFVALPVLAYRGLFDADRRDYAIFPDGLASVRVDALFNERSDPQPIRPNPLIAAIEPYRTGLALPSLTDLIQEDAPIILAKKFFETREF